LKITHTYKRITAFVFFAAFLAQTSNKIIIIADYYTNSAAYAKNCINKSRPMMHCNGHCQMMRKLQAEEKKDQENPENRGQNRNEIALSARSFFPLVTLPVISSLNISIPVLYQCDPLIERSLDIFHPPQV